MKRLTLAIAAVALAITASAIPAKRGILSVEQPDGTTLQVRLHGDEHSHCYTTPDGLPLMQKDGFLYYATLDAQGRALPSTLRAVDTNIEQGRALVGNAATEIRQAIMARNIATTQEVSTRMRIPQSGMGLFSDSFPVKGSPKALVVLVQYSDVKFSTPNPGTYFTNLLTQPGFNQQGATGSALDYFTEVSKGQFTPQFDVYGPITLPQNQAYYGGNDSYGDDQRPEMMAVHAVQALNATVDFSQYDTDNDGYIDNIYIFYAGRGEADGGSSNTVWPHSWYVYSGAGRSVNVDGVRLDRYACSNEMQAFSSSQVVVDGIGTFTHEFSHVMGLPDLYHTAAEADYTPSTWDIMDYGSYNNNSRTPPGYSAFERLAMGWIDPIVLDGPASITLEHIESSNECCIIQTGKDTEYFLFENRQQKGWDKYLPGHGMLIWHIDFVPGVWNANKVNNTKSHQYVDIEEANNYPSYYTESGYAFPGTSNKRSFTDTTTPGMRTWTGASLNLPITNITETNGIITFDVAGGGAKIDIPTPTQPSGITSDGFVATWNAVAGATDYLLTVETDLPEQYDTFAYGFEKSSLGGIVLPEGWTATASGSYTSDGYYGKDMPSFKIQKNGATLTTAKFDNDIAKIAFWYRGASADAANSLDVLVSSTGASFTLLHSIKPLDNNEGHTIEITEVPQDIHYVQFKYTKSGSGNVALDDIEIATGKSVNYILPGYNAVSTNGKTSYAVTNLPENVRKYRYAVAATDGRTKTQMSEYFSIEVPTSGIENVAADTNDTPARYYNLQGIQVNPDNAQHGIYIRIQNGKSQKVVIR